MSIFYFVKPSRYPHDQKVNVEPDPDESATGLDKLANVPDTLIADCRAGESMAAAVAVELAKKN